jgi:hypothetical protein
MTAATSPPPPPSLANASWGWFLFCFSRDGCRITTTTPPRSQTRGGGVFQFLSLATAATSPPPPPLARKRELGVVLILFLSRRLPHHHHHPPSLANTRWGCFSISFSCNGRHVTAATPPRSQTRGGGVFRFLSLATAATSPPPPPLARKRELGVVLGLFFSRRPPRHDHPWVTTSTTNPSLAPRASRRGLSMFLQHHEPPPSPQQRGRVVISIYMYMTTPSLV